MPEPCAFHLPSAPPDLPGPVKVWSAPVVIPTYETAPPDKNPMFLENRVYQGSSGRVYPLPFIDRVAQHSKPREWSAVHLENEYLRVMILPEIGGRIHVALDKTNGYDFFYRQNVIKPALVGLAGPWISGGVEFNWPQHHRPATYMPVEVTIEQHDDGSVTAWCSDHDPMERLKAAHGVCLYPGRAYIELKVRLYNRTPLTQTFLWWANVAVHVHERYQSFFPPDVHFVADHAKRATSTYPLCTGTYYGINYGSRVRNGIQNNEKPSRFIPPGDYASNDLTWYANIPVPTSYMAVGSEQDFFGGYDHFRQAGFVSVANHHIAPGKKQWTWGNSEFGYAWDRNLTDNDGPYIELMSGVYTDNQPDFSFLAPGEAKTFSQHWYPIQHIGIPQQANQHAALRCTVENGIANIGLSVTERYPDATLKLCAGQASTSAAGLQPRLTPGEKSAITEWHKDLQPGSPVTFNVKLPPDTDEQQLQIELRSHDGTEIISYNPAVATRSEQAVPEPASEPPAPEQIESVDELYLTGLHLWQYRHATQSPEPYWREALQRDPGDSRTNSALGIWYIRRGEFARAEQHFRIAITRLTKRNPNPSDGEAFYHLGLALRYQGRDQEAYRAFYKSIWNFAVRSAGYHALAELDVKAGRYQTALEHLEFSLATNIQNTNARNLGAVLLRIVGRDEEASRWVANVLKQDPTDPWARYLNDGTLPASNQILLDLAFDYARAGLYAESAKLLSRADLDAKDGTVPICCYALAAFYGHVGQAPSAGRSPEPPDLGAAERHSQTWLARARQASPDYCFPNRLEELILLERAVAQDATDAKARYYVGNFYYDRRRYAEAIAAWEASAALEIGFATVWRNLGIAYFNVQNNPIKARAAFDRAFSLNPQDARVFYERDQLAKRIGMPVQARLAELEAHRDLVELRDDLSVELAALFLLTGRYEDALTLVSTRQFQPWEGGEGQALALHVRTHISLGRRALVEGDPVRARSFFEQALQTPPNLGEARHPLANRANIYYWLGVGRYLLGDSSDAQRIWEEAASAQGDFQEMSVRPFSEMSYYRACSLRQLGRESEASRLLQELLEHARKLRSTPAAIDYFSTSLPSMLLFKEELTRKNSMTADFLEAQARSGLGDTDGPASLLHKIMSADPSHALAADFLVELECNKLLEHALDARDKLARR